MVKAVLARAAIVRIVVVQIIRRMSTSTFCRRKLACCVPELRGPLLTATYRRADWVALEVTTRWNVSFIWLQFQARLKQKGAWLRELELCKNNHPRENCSAASPVHG